jgi:hypothetical protein
VRRGSDRGSILLPALAGFAGLVGLLAVGVPRLQGWVATQQLEQALRLVAASGQWPMYSVALAAQVASDDPELALSGSTAARPGQVAAYADASRLALATVAGGRCLRVTLPVGGPVEARTGPATGCRA